MDNSPSTPLLHLLMVSAMSVVVLAPTGCGALLIQALRVPAWVPLHQSALLSCQYDAQGEPLYSVKWYKNKQEFYRYLSDEQPNIKTFAMDGVHVDESRSNDTTLQLSDVTASTAGEYTCEVSVDAPTFLTAVTSARLNVVTLPLKGPQISGLDEAYFPGQTIVANCTIGTAIPKATLRWFLNGNEVDHTHLIEAPSSGTASSTGASTWRALRLPVETGIFGAREGRRAEFRCSASVGDLPVGHYDFSAILRDMKPGNLAQYSGAPSARHGGGRSLASLAPCIALITLLALRG